MRRALNHHEAVSWTRRWLTLGVLLAIPTTCNAQYGPTGTYNYFGGVGPYGWGAWGWGVTGYGVPTSPPPPPMMVQQPVSQQVAYSDRFAIDNARQNMATMAANRFREQALAATARPRSRAPVPKFDVETRNSDLAAPSPKEGRRDLDDRIGGLIDDTGQMLWPVPLDDVLTPRLAAARMQTESAVRDAYQEWVLGGKASLTAIVQARQSLRQFGLAALSSLDMAGDSIRYDRLKNQLQGVDQVLQDMVNAPAPTNQKDAK